MSPCFHSSSSLKLPTTAAAQLQYVHYCTSSLTLLMEPMGYASTSTVLILSDCRIHKRASCGMCFRLSWKRKQLNVCSLIHCSKSNSKLYYECLQLQNTKRYKEWHHSEAHNIQLAKKSPALMEPQAHYKVHTNQLILASFNSSYLETWYILNVQFTECWWLACSTPASYWELQIQILACRQATLTNVLHGVMSLEVIFTAVSRIKTFIISFYTF